MPQILLTKQVEKYLHHIILTPIYAINCQIRDYNVSWRPQEQLTVSSAYFDIGSNPQTCQTNR